MERDRGSKQLLWEQLVTEEHVRAARIRVASKSALIMGIILTIVGGLWFLTTVLPGGLLTPERVVSQRIADLKRRVQHVVDGIPAPKINAHDFHNLPPASELPKVINTIQRELNKTENLPENLIINLIDSKTFWNGNWKMGKLAVLEGDQLKVVGALVTVRRRVQNRGKGHGKPVFRTVVARWIGLFRKRGDSWKSYCLADKGFLQVSGANPVLSQMIPVSLLKLVPQDQEDEAHA